MSRNGNQNISVVVSETGGLICGSSNVYDACESLRQSSQLSPTVVHLINQNGVSATGFYINNTDSSSNTPESAMTMPIALSMSADESQGIGDANGTAAIELHSFEEWVKESDSLSSLNLCADMKPEDDDLSDIFNCKSSTSTPLGFKENLVSLGFSQNVGYLSSINLSAECYSMAIPDTDVLTDVVERTTEESYQVSNELQSGIPVKLLSPQEIESLPSTYLAFEDKTGTKNELSYNEKCNIVTSSKNNNKYKNAMNNSDETLPFMNNCDFKNIEISNIDISVDSDSCISKSVNSFPVITVVSSDDPINFKEKLVCSKTKEKFINLNTCNSQVCVLENPVNARNNVNPFINQSTKVKNSILKNSKFLLKSNDKGNLIKSGMDYKVDDCISAGTIVNTDSSGLAIVKMSVDQKENIVTIGIISSNKEHTIFKIKTNDLLVAVSNIKEDSLDPLGITYRQLIRCALTAKKFIKELIFKKNADIGKSEYIKRNSSVNFEVNQVIKEMKSPLSATRSLNLMSKKRNNGFVPLILNSPKTGYSENVKTLYIHTVQPSSASVVNSSKGKKNMKSKKTSNASEKVEVQFRSGGPPTMVTVPSVLDTLSANNEENENSDLKITAQFKKQKSKADDIINKALDSIGIKVETLIPVCNSEDKKKRQWICTVSNCKKSFPKVNLLKIHLLGHHGVRPFKCMYPSCEWAFYTVYKLKRHMETHLGRRDYVCTETGCNKRFSTIYNLRTHERLHNRPPRWLCSDKECNLSFYSRQQLEVHMATHEGVEPPYKCDVEGCTKSFFNSTSLSSHIRSHSRKDDLRCTWEGCNKVFEKPCRFKAHMLMHLGKKQFACKFEGCNWAFYTASKLRRHERKHTNDRKFICLFCSRSFLRSEHLKGHLYTHTGLRSFHCPVENCDAKFSAKSSLYVHLKKHKEKKTSFSCPIDSCNRYYGSKANLRIHMEKKHGPSSSHSMLSSTLENSSDTLLNSVPGTSEEISQFELSDFSGIPKIMYKNTHPSNSAATNDLNILANQKRKKKSKKTSSDDNLSIFTIENLLESASESLQPSNQLTSSLLLDECIVNSDLYQDTLMGHLILSDQQSDAQSTINLRDLE